MASLNNSPTKTNSKQSKSTSFSLLEHTQRTQMEALESRTARRIETLLGGPPEFNGREKSGDNESISSKVERGSPLLDAMRQGHRSSPPGYEEATAVARNTGETPLLQSSIGKRNITQRRSRGRSSRDDGTIAPDPTLVARRPRSRSKDRRYSVESTVVASNPGNFVAFRMNEAPESLTARQGPDVWSDSELVRGSYSQSPVTPARVHGTILTDSRPDLHSVNRGVGEHERPQTRTSDREPKIEHDPILSPVLQDDQSDDSHTSFYDDREAKNGGSDDLLGNGGVSNGGNSCNMKKEEMHGGVFLKKYIPEQDSYPALHDHLFDLCDHRQSIAAAMNLALEDDDVIRYDQYRDLFDQANQKMHVVLQEGLRVATEEHWDSKAPPRFESSSARTEPIFSVASSRRHAQPPTVFSNPGSFSVNEIRWRQVDSLPFVESAPKRHLKQSYKETDHSFDLLFISRGCGFSICK
jgi:hypothetical protein